MIDLSRARGFLAVVFGVGAVVAVLTLFLNLVCGPTPSWLQPQIRLTAWKEVEREAGRISGIRREARRGAIGSDTRLGMIIGSSSSARGLDTAQLDKSFGPPYRWFLSYTVAGNFDKLSEVTRFVKYIEPKPAVLIFAVHPLMLAEFPRPLEDEEDVEDRREGGRPSAPTSPVAAARRYAKGLLWPARNRYRIQWKGYQKKFKYRILLFDALGQDFNATVKPTVKPWESVEPPRWPNPNSRADDLFTADFEVWKAQGLLDPKSYHSEGVQANALTEMLKTCRDLGIPTGIVLMPELRGVRAALPPEAETNFKVVLSRAGGEVPILDLRDAVSGEFFGDALHLKEEGKRMVSTRVAEWVRETLLNSIAFMGERR